MDAGDIVGIRPDPLHLIEVTRGEYLIKILVCCNQEVKRVIHYYESPAGIYPLLDSALNLTDRAGARIDGEKVPALKLDMITGIGSFVCLSGYFDCMDRLTIAANTSAHATYKMKVIGEDEAQPGDEIATYFGCPSYPNDGGICKPDGHKWSSLVAAYYKDTEEIDIHTACLQGEAGGQWVVGLNDFGDHLVMQEDIRMYASANLLESQIPHCEAPYCKFRCK